MTNYSRTTLRELKKRYLNVLKKCLLANLLAFSFMLPARADPIITSSEELYEAFKNGISSEISEGTNIYLKLNQEEYFVYDAPMSGWFNNLGTITIDGDVTFTSYFRNGPTGKVDFLGNVTIETPYEVSNNFGRLTNTGTATFHKNVAYYKNTMKSGGWTTHIALAGKTTFLGDFIFGGERILEDGTVEDLGNKVLYSHVLYGAGVYFNGDIEIKGHAKFIGTEGTGQYGVEGGGFNNINKLSFNTIEVYNNHIYTQSASHYSTAGGGFVAGQSNQEAITTVSGKAIIGGYKKDITGNYVWYGNSATSGKDAEGGGLALWSNAKVLFNGDTIIQANKVNASLSYGGGVSLRTGYLSFSNVDIINNIAIASKSSYGGGLYNRDGTVDFNSNFTFAKNNADFGKDIYNSSCINLLNKNGTVGTIEVGIAGTTAGIINKSGTGLLVLGDNSENHEYEGAFTQTAGTTIANSEAFFSHELAQNTINGGEFKTHGAEIAYKAVVGQNVDDTGAVLSVGKVMHYTTKPKMEVNASTLANITFAGEDMGATIGVGTYNKTEQEKEIALVGDRPIEYLDDKGTEDTSDDEMVRYQATDKLFTIDTLASGERTMFKVTGALPNEKGNKIAFANGIVEIDESIGKTGAIYELDNSVLETTSVQNKVLSKNMILGEAQEYSFTELEVSEGTTLDVKNKKVSTDTLTMNDNAILNIDLNSVTDHGKMTIGEVQNAEKGKLSLKLTKGLAQETGIYQVFDRDNDLTLQENKLFKIKDLENGAYEVSKKTSENLMKDFDMSASESAVAVALIESESAHKVFNQMQEEMLEALQSEDKGKVQKAKKALLAVGAKEHPVEQSVASEHLVALQNVVQAELRGTTVGHSGGDTDPRAKVYIKGLYDRTKSSMGEGFRARSKGAVLGVQSEVTEDLTLGVGYATSQTTAKEDLRRTEVDTNTGFISAHYQPNAWWVSGLATFSRGEYEEEKQILSSMGKASYDVDSWGAQVMTGYDIKLETAIITPEVGLRYLSVKQEDYTDTLGTTVSGTRSDYLTALVGMKGTWDMGAVRPTAGVTVGYDIISDDVSALNTLANGASYTVNGEALDRLSTGVSLGIEADLGERTTLKLEYSGTFRKEYADHSGMLKLEVRF